MKQNTGSVYVLLICRSLLPQHSQQLRCRFFRARLILPRRADAGGAAGGTRALGHALLGGADEVGPEVEQAGAEADAAGHSIVDDDARGKSTPARWLLAHGVAPLHRGAQVAGVAHQKDGGEVFDEVGQPAQCGVRAARALRLTMAGGAKSEQVFGRVGQFECDGTGVPL